MQLPEGSPAARELGAMVLQALENNPLFISAAVPARVFSRLFNRYEGGQSFGTHVTMRSGRSRAPVIAFGLDLSAALFFAGPDEYDGGELVVEDTYGVKSVKLPAGHMILYPATSLHHVRRLTRGSRLASFFWIQSMIRDDGERTLLFDLDVAFSN
jgi:PKHD-type hydroxylase